MHGLSIVLYANYHKRFMIENDVCVHHDGANETQEKLTTSPHKIRT